MFKFLSPVHYIRRIVGIRNDIKGKSVYVQYLPELFSDKFFMKYRKSLRKDSMYIGVDLIPEIKLQKVTDLELENEEKRRLAIEVSKFNEVFAKHGLLEFVKMIPKKIDTEDHYGFLVEIVYKYTNLTAKAVSYVTFYSLFTLGIISTTAYLLFINLL